MEVTQRRPVGSNMGKWSSTRQGTLAIALVTTLIAAAILVFALHRYRQSVETSSKPATVLVANRFIEKGTSGAAIGVGRYFTTTKILDKQVAQGAFASSAALHGEVAADDIYPGQQLTAADFVGGGLFYSKLPRQPARDLGTARYQSRADRQPTDRRPRRRLRQLPEGSEKTRFLRLVAPDVVVLDAGQASRGRHTRRDHDERESNVVLEVDVHQAAELAFAADNGKVWLILRPANGTHRRRRTRQRVVDPGKTSGFAGGSK